jgi:hypothetical protein
MWTECKWRGSHASMPAFLAWWKVSDPPSRLFWDCQRPRSIQYIYRMTVGTLNCGCKARSPSVIMSLEAVQSGCMWRTRHEAEGAVTWKLVQCMALSYLRQLVASFSPQQPRFDPDPRSSHVGFVVDKVALGQVSSKYFGFPCQFSFHRLPHTHDL